MAELDDDKQLEEHKQNKEVDIYDYVPQDKQMPEIHDDKQLEEHKQNKVSTYDYLPQDFSFKSYNFERRRRRIRARARKYRPLPSHINRSLMEVSHLGLLVLLSMIWISSDTYWEESPLLPAGCCCVPAAITQ